MERECSACGVKFPLTCGICRDHSHWIAGNNTVPFTPTRGIEIVKPEESCRNCIDGENMLASKIEPCHSCWDDRDIRSHNAFWPREQPLKFQNRPEPQPEPEVMPLTPEAAKWILSKEKAFSPGHCWIHITDDEYWRIARIAGEA
jgi:hypothetical protein